VSFLVTAAILSIALTTSFGVGTKMTSGPRNGAAFASGLGYRRVT